MPRIQVFGNSGPDDVKSCWMENLAVEDCFAQDHIPSNPCYRKDASEDQQSQMEASYLFV